MEVKSFLIDRVLSKNYFLLKLASDMSYRQRFDGEDLIIVYQMGKVGSSTITQSLKLSQSIMPVLQVHVLSDKGLGIMEDAYYGDRNKNLQRARWPESKNLFVSYYLRRRLKDKRDPGKIKIVTLVREPIARNVSDFFHSADVDKARPYLPDFYDEYGGSEDSIERLRATFLELFHEGSSAYDWPLHWFDTELKEVFDIDVYKDQFPQSEGYFIYHGDSADVLLLKLRQLNQVAEQAIGQFLGIKELKLLKANVAPKKRYYSIYRRFIETVRLPEDYVRGVYNSKYVRHFYSDQEIHTFYQKWTKCNFA